jgi:hypothetical protein
MNLSQGHLGGTIFMRDEPDFEDVQFVELLGAMMPEIAAVLPQISGSRGSYKKRKEPSRDVQPQVPKPKKKSAKKRKKHR